MKLFQKNALRIVTGADSSHALSLMQLLSSIARWEPGVQVTIYDLGLTGVERANAQAVLPSARIETFDFDAWPAYFNIRVDAGQYAWKPVIFWAELQKSDVPLVWMDAGNRLRRDMRRLRRELRRDGFVSYASLGTIRDWTHPAMLRRLGLPDDWDQDRRNLTGGLVAIDPRRQTARLLASDWAHHAQDRDCIAPAGSDRQNHRQDQALLTVLAYASGVIDAPTRRIMFLGRKRQEVMLQQDVEPRGVR